MAKGGRSGKKTQGPKPIAEADKPQVLYDLGYEIDQLRGAYNLALENRRNTTEHNAFVVSWLTAARNLTEFFMGNKTWPADVLNFVDNEYQLFSGEDAERLFKDISNQVSHLALREAKHEEKLSPNSDDMKLLEDEIERFRKHLRKDYKPMLVVKTDPVLFVAAPARANATNSPSWIRSWWGWLLPWKK